MKNTQTCPKCQGIEIVKVPGGNNWNGLENKIHVNSFKTVPVLRYVCVECGFSEEWVELGKDLDAVRNKYLNKVKHMPLGLDDANSFV